jgi:hypothetical protein
MHVSELERFARTGTFEPLPRSGRAEGSAGVVVIPSTKDEDPLRVAVSKAVLAAAQRVRAEGTFDRQHFQKAVTAACVKAKVPGFGTGSLWISFLGCIVSFTVAYLVRSIFPEGGADRSVQVDHAGAARCRARWCRRR